MILWEIHVALIRAISLHIAYCKLHLPLINKLFGFHDIPIFKKLIEKSALRAFSAVTRLTVHRRPQVIRGRFQLVGTFRRERRLRFFGPKSEALKYVWQFVFDKHNFSPGTMVSGSLHFEAEVLQKERKIQKAHDSDVQNWRKMTKIENFRKF